MPFESQNKETQEACKIDTVAELREMVGRLSNQEIISYLRASSCYTELQKEWSETILPCSAEEEEPLSVEELTRHWPITDEDRDLILALSLHHKETAFHAVKTARLIIEILEDNPDIARLLEDEGVMRTDLIRAALLHDIGKLDIPYEVLSAKPSYEELLQVLRSLVQNSDTETLALAARKGVDGVPSEESLRAADVRPVHVVPITHVGFTTEVLEKLQNQGFAITNASLMDILDLHEERTRTRLADEPLIAGIAGHHHTCWESNHPAAAGTTGVASRICTSLLRIADLAEAMTARRAYSPGRPLIVAMEEEIRTAAKHHVPEEVLRPVLGTLLKRNAHRLARECQDSTDVCAFVCSYCKEHQVTIPVEVLRVASAQQPAQL